MVRALLRSGANVHLRDNVSNRRVIWFDCRDQYHVIHVCVYELGTSVYVVCLGECVCSALLNEIEPN